MRKKHLLRVSGVVLGVALLAGACGSSSKSNAGGATTTAASGGSGGSTPSGVKCDPVSLGFFGALTGSNANLGINIKNGATLAVDQWNQKNPDCKVTLKDFDSQGDPKQAPALADKAISDKSVVGIIGPAFSGESKAANPKFQEAGLPIITPSATNPTLSQQGWTIFHRMLATDAKQGPDVAKYISDTLKAQKIVVIDDQSEYGKGIADAVRQTLGAKVVANDSIQAGGTDFSAAVTKAKGAGADAVFFGGYYSDAAKLATQLKDGGVTATFVSGDGSADVGLIKEGGPAVEGAYVSCPCNLQGTPDFLAAYKAKFNDDPRTYGAEAFDSANSFLAAIAAGKVDRKAINDFLSTYDAQGVSRHIKWDSHGEIGEGPTYIFQVKSGQLTPVGSVA
jgi:branched-chain amino acid transport system substrate-binding protein